MGRVTGRADSTRPSRARSKVAARKPRPHKVIFESFTEEKKKLLTISSFQPRAPPGFTFVAAGNPPFTNKCKELSRVEGHQVYMVSARPENRAHKKASHISHHIHRIGHHFASAIVNKACWYLDVDVDSSGQVTRRRDRAHAAVLQLQKRHGTRRARRSLIQSNAATSIPASQKALDRQAEDAIKDLFPKIPEDDVKQIVSRAFQMGSNRVGVAENLPLLRRVQLAVIAHIRHVYTNYDKLLKETSYHDARGKIEKTCLDQLVRWRGDKDDENDADELEEILREVIVISDDESGDESDDESDDEQLPGRDSSVELISDQVVHHEIASSPMDMSRDLSIDDDQSHTAGGRQEEITYVPRKIQRPKRMEGISVDRRGLRRYEHWSQALDRSQRKPGPLAALGDPPRASEDEPRILSPREPRRVLGDQHRDFEDPSRMIYQHLWVDEERTCFYAAKISIVVQKQTGLCSLSLRIIRGQTALFEIM
ncbi:MAG: hypothetical protein M1819_002043 [Sarea resinae]|nr:MAG: hypothetical protein M1819_002043 [Sarea resinae]